MNSKNARILTSRSAITTIVDFCQPYTGTFNAQTALAFLAKAIQDNQLVIKGGCDDANQSQ